MLAHLPALQSGREPSGVVMASIPSFPGCAKLEAKDKDLALFELRRQALAEQPGQDSAHAE